MKNSTVEKATASVGIIGFGAFGQLIAKHLNQKFELLAYDPSPHLGEDVSKLGVSLASLDQVAKCDVIIIASPVSSFESVVKSIAAICRPGAIIVDVGSVKVQPSEIMDRFLPEYVSIVATHPLFGPQSACNGIRGLKIAICPIRGHHHIHVAAFLRKYLGLHVIMTTPDQHDRDAATVQGITHLIAKVLLRMEPLPSRMTTKSFDLISEAISMVQHDAPEVFEAIENANPYAKEVRQRFFGLAFELSSNLEDSEEHD
ncbi:prephenate dehydrogenase [Ruegeria halocynthiae]|uniref:Prephenate dehydrogenase n=1 Tax=Ruegeria halocynthiae TaxID=985054 RepID=A0A1H2ZSC6_9RHOB|nr:prephenate dehydrogenase [Ruegeria halocynthiae]SDX19579.1 prephenate dehydrogenase [Ruegeria halocynthiae]